MKRRCDMMATWELREPGLLEYGDITTLEAQGHLYGRGYEAEGEVLPARLAEVLSQVEEQLNGWEDYKAQLLAELEGLQQEPCQHGVQYELSAVKKRLERAEKQVAELTNTADSMIQRFNDRDVPEVEDNLTDESVEYNRTHWELVWKEGFEVIFQTKRLIEKTKNLHKNKAIDLLHRALKRLLTKTYHLKDGKVVKHNDKLLKAGELSYPHYAACKLMCVRTLAELEVSWAIKALPDLEKKFVENKIQERLLQQTTIPDSVFIRQEPERVMGTIGLDPRDTEEAIDLHQFCLRRAKKLGDSALQVYQQLVASEE
jgi:hypothetical protein